MILFVCPKCWHDDHVVLLCTGSAFNFQHFIFLSDRITTQFFSVNVNRVLQTHLNMDTSGKHNKQKIKTIRWLQWCVLYIIRGDMTSAVMGKVLLRSSPMWVCRDLNIFNNVSYLTNVKRSALYVCGSRLTFVIRPCAAPHTLSITITALHECFFLKLYLFYGKSKRSK